MNNEALLKMINKRIDELAKSYAVLNENHQSLENGFIEMRTEWKTTKALAKFIFGTSLLSLIIGFATLLKTLGVI